MAQPSNADSIPAPDSVHQTPRQGQISSNDRPTSKSKEIEDNESIAESEADTEIADEELAEPSSLPQETDEKPTTKNSAIADRGSSDDIEEDEEDEEDRYWAAFQINRKRARKRQNSNRDSLSSIPNSLSDWERTDDSSLSSNGWSSDNSQTRDSNGSKRRRHRHRRRRSHHRDPESPTTERRKRGRPRKESRSEEDEKQRRMSSESATAPSASNDNDKRKGRRLGKNPNRTDKAGRTTLFKATSAGHFDVVKDLIAQGANVNIRDNAGWTPLHEAALKGQILIAKFFIECKADVNARGFGGDTPLHDACSNSFADCVRVLVDAGADVFALNDKKERPLDVCDDDECRAILEDKMNQLEQRVAKDDKGRTLLHGACESGDVETVQTLLSEGADVNAQDNTLRTPLHEAVLHNHVAVATILIDLGADVNFAGHEGNTPLHYASQQGHEECVQRLIDAGADVNIENDDGKNSYYLTNSPSIRRVLTEKMDEARQRKEAEENDALDSQAVIIARKGRSRGSKGDRPLTREERKIQAYMRVFEKMEKPRRSRTMEGTDGQEEAGLSIAPRKRRAYRRRKSESFESREASEEPPDTPRTAKKMDPTKFDPHKKDTSGRTYLHKWAKRGEFSVVEALLKNGANTNETDNAGWTPLHEAALRGHVDVVRLLIDNGANVNSKSADQDTPLHDATENNHEKVVKLLLERGADPHASNASDRTPLDIAVENENDRIEQMINTWISKYKDRHQSRRKIEEQKMQSEERESVIPVPICLPKKRRLVKAAHFETPNNKKTGEKWMNTASDTAAKKASMNIMQLADSDIKMEPKSKVDESPKQTPAALQYPVDLPTHTPIPTPPPESWHLSGKGEVKKEDDISRALDDPMRYLPLYTVQLLDQSCHVVDLQVSMLIGISLVELRQRYPHLWKRIITTIEKERLWSHLAPMLCSDDSQMQSKKDQFLETTLYFIRLDEAVTLIKADYDYLSEKLITITLDIGYQEECRETQLPPKLAMKMKKWGTNQPISESPC